MSKTSRGSININKSQNLKKDIHKRNRSNNKLKNSNTIDNGSSKCVPKVKKIHKKASLFFKGKELIKDEQKIGSLINNNGREELELSLIILSMNDSTFVDENKVKEKLVQKISDECNLHKGNKELFICVTCNVAFCSHCAEKHKSHEIIERKNIIQFKNELKELNEELSQNLNESNFSSIYENKNNNSNDFSSDSNKMNSKYINNIDKLQNRLDNIKKLHRGIINNYKREVDKILPYLLEYKEKIEQMIDLSYKLDTIKNDQEFIDYYYWYSNIKKKKEKINMEIQNLHKKKQNFNEIMEFFDDKINSIYINTEQDYKILKNCYYNYNNNSDNDNQFRKNNNNNNISCSNSQNSFLYNSYVSPIKKNNNAPLKLNLFSLLNSNINNIINENNNNNSKNQKKKNSSNKDINCKIDDNFFNKNNKEDANSSVNSSINSSMSKNRFITKYKGIFEKDNGYSRKRHLSHRIINKKIGGFEEIEEKSEKEESIDEPYYTKIIYNIKPKTKNIYCFNFEKKVINEIELNMNNLNISSFGSYHGTLNYKNDFYISGGYSSIKLFCKYNQKENNLLQLKEMPSAHSYHGMLGIKNCIYVISGFKSKKVERYNIFDNTWENLEDLKESRSWPNCLDYKNEYIYVFGGLFNNYEEENNILIERFDINNIKNNWESLYLNNENKIKLPFYFGLINFDYNHFLLIGGKFNPKENSNNNCYKFIVDEKRIEKDEDYKLPQSEEFNGKMFTKFSNNYYGEFSSLSYGKVYLLNSIEKTIEQIK